MKQSGRSFIPLFALIKLLLRLAAYTCLSLLSPWRSLHPLSPRQHKLRDLESGVGWQEEKRDKQSHRECVRETEQKSNSEERGKKCGKGINIQMKRNSLDVITVKENKINNADLSASGIKSSVFLYSSPAIMIAFEANTTKAHVYHARKSSKLGDFQVL